jgi:5'-deoxynucleotidase YfbR-like HD superfamily hydrolase
MNANNWMLTHTGRRFDFDCIEDFEFTIEDIAHALSHTCRFGGHVKDFYSVAQHSVIVSYNVPNEFRLAALLHDAPEAFLVDVPMPLKRRLPAYKEIEREVWTSIALTFDLPLDLPECVHVADRRALMAERRDLMPKQRESWSWGQFDSIEPLTEKIYALTSQSAKLGFLGRFNALTKGNE